MVVVAAYGSGVGRYGLSADVYNASSGQLAGPASTVSDPADGPVVKFGSASADGTAFVHPGITVTQSQLTFVRDQIAAGRDPWKTYFAQMRMSAPKYGTSAGVAFASLSYVAHPVDYVTCGSGGASTAPASCNDELNDASAAYAAALVYSYTTGPDRAAYAQQAVKIINAWAAVLRHRTYNGPNDTATNAAYLQASWVAPLWTRAAEIMRYTYTAPSGSTKLNLTTVTAMLNKAYVPFVKAPWRGGGANWLMSFDEATLDIAIFEDDHTMYANALARWRVDVPTVVYLGTDTNPYSQLQGLPLAPKGTAYDTATTTPATMIDYWSSPKSFPDGLEGETCRDAGHMSMGFGSMIDTAETARLQGVDLYAEQATRIATGLELNAGYLSSFLSGVTPSDWPCPSAMGSTGQNSGWPATYEIAYNEFVNRLGLPMPKLSSLMAAYVRPSTFKANHAMFFEGLTNTESPRGTACATPDSRLGALTTTVSVPASGTYRMWARTKPAASGSGYFYAQVDGGCPFVAGGGSTQPPGVWTWVRYQDGVALSAGTHTIVLSGLSTDLQVSRLIVTSDATCQPSGLYNGCADATPPSPPSTLTASAVSSSSIGLAWSGASAASVVDHYVVYRDGAAIDTSYDPTYVDTGLADGSTHTYRIVAVDAVDHPSAPSVSATARTPYQSVDVSVAAPTATQDAITFTVGVSHPAHVTDVLVSVDGELAGDVTSAPYQVVWDSTTAPNGHHLVQAVVRQDDGTLTASATVDFTVYNPDRTPPSAPTQLVSAFVSQTVQTISWADATDNIGVAGYTIYRDGVSISSTDDTHFRDEGVRAGRTYAYTVRAVDNAGNVSSSSTALSVSVPDVTAPGVPTNPTTQLLSQDSQLISWDAVTDNIGVDAYQVYRDGVLVGTSTTASYVDSGLVVGRTYVWTVSASDDAQNRSALSAPVTATVADVTAPSAPGALSVARNSQTSQTVSWVPATDNVAVTGYAVYRDGALLATTTVPSYTDGSVVATATYVYSVVALDAANNASAPSAVLTVLVPDVTPPSVPGSLGAVLNSQTSQTISWAPAADNVAVAGYSVYRDGTLVASTTDPSYVDNQVVAARTYSYSVVALDTAGNASAASAALPVLVADVTAPSAPGGLTVTQVGQTSQTVSWTPAGDNVAVTGYTVYRDGAQVATTTVPSYTDTAVTATGTYVYTVVATDAAGNASDASQPLSTTVADITAPNPPSGLTAVQNSQTSQTVSWTAATDNVAVTGYSIYRDGAQLASTTDPSFTDTTVDATGTYAYTVVAVDAAGNVSAASPSLSTTVADITAPAAPTGLTAVQNSQTTLTVSWTPATDNVAVTGYTIYRDGSPVATTTDPSYADTQVSAAQTYAYTVVARDAAGNSSAASDPLSAPVPDITPPSVPGGMSVSSATPTSVTLQWNAATDNVAVTSYTVYRNGNPIATTSGTSYTDTTAASDTDYSYAVLASDAAGLSSVLSTPASVHTPLPPDITAPSAPGTPVLNARTGTTLTIAWPAATDDRGVASYTVYRNGTAVATGLTGTTWTDSGLTSVTTYSYTVTAQDAAGNVSSPSTPLSATTADSIAPSRPPALVGYATSTTATYLKWGTSTDNVGVTGYRVVRNGATIATTTAKSYADTGLTPGTSYAYSVTAIDAAGNASAAAALNVSTLQPVVAGGAGLTGSYFANKTLTGTPIVRLDPSINFNWGTGAPTSGIGVDNFSVRWTGTITPTTSGSYTVFADTNDGVRLWINGTLLIDQWVTGTVAAKAPYSFTAGSTYTLRAEYYENTSVATAKLSWSGPGITKTVIPSSVLSSVTPGLTGTYYKTNDLSGTPALVRPDSTVNFAWGTAAPDPALTADNFSARWTGRLKTPTAGSYTFTSDNDEGIRLWLNNQLIIDNWTPHSLVTNTATITLPAGTVPIRLEYRELTGAASVNLSWSYGSTAKAIIPASSLLDR